MGSSLGAAKSANTAPAATQSTTSQTPRRPSNRDPPEMPRDQPEDLRSPWPSSTGAPARCAEADARVGLLVGFRGAAGLAGSGGLARRHLAALGLALAAGPGLARGLRRRLAAAAARRRRGLLRRG